MKFSIFNIFDYYSDLVGSIQQVHKNAIEQAILAEELGYESYFIAEHHFTQYGVLPSPFIFLAALSQRTQNIKLGTGVAVLPFHDPRRLAEDVAQLDLLSEGRFIFGVGSGFDSKEFQGFGKNIATKRELFDETLSITKHLLSGEAIETCAGNFYDIQNARLNIPPLENLNEKIYMAALGCRTTYFIGLKGENLLLSPFEGINASFNDLKLAIEGYQKGYAEKHTNGNTGDIIVNFFCHVADSDKEARKLIAANFDRFVSTRDHPPLAIPQPGYFYDGYVNNGLTLFGSVETLAQKLIDIQDAGVSHAMLLHQFGGLSNQQVQGSMQRFINEVVPLAAKKGLKM